MSAPTYCAKCGAGLKTLDITRDTLGTRHVVVCSALSCQDVAVLHVPFASVERGWSA